MNFTPGERVKLNQAAFDNGVPDKGLTGTVVKETADYTKIHWDGSKETQDNYYATCFVERVNEDA